MQTASLKYTTNRSVIMVSLAVSLVLMIIKFVAYALTASSAILSDALESIINVVAGGFAFFSLVLSARPPDKTHPYGHGKIEYFSAGFEGALIVLAAVGIFFSGLYQTFHPKELPTLDIGLLLVLGASLVNLALGLFLVRMGKKNDSLVLLADGKHILTDVYTSAGVLAGLLVVHVTGWFRGDGVIACVVGVHIVYSGSQLVRSAFAGLMNRSEPALLDEICSLLETHRRDVWIDVHRLRAWRSGAWVHLDFHLILPRDIPLWDAHKQVKDLEKIFMEYFGGQADVLIHLDPCDDPECPICGHEPCELRNGEPRGQSQWKRDWVECHGDVTESRAEERVRLVGL
ncbi:MAG: hypothetical protein QG577_1814 [Thermodesulfobacteriota bacterium]|nr:hypothetical protein [Thermodesulfobacteriota bacterium]